MADTSDPRSALARARKALGAAILLLDQDTTTADVTATANLLESTAHQLLADLRYGNECSQCHEKLDDPRQHCEDSGECVSLCGCDEHQDPAE